MSLKISELPNQKADIYQRPVMSEGIIPRHPSVCLFSGRSGSGKTNLMLSLLTLPQFYGGDDIGKRHYFDHIVLMGSTVDSDDLYDTLKSQKVHIETVLEPTADSIQQVLDYQKTQIKQLGIARAPRTLLVLEDMQTHSAGKDSVMRSRAFLECFLANRHNNLSVFLCGQSYTATPRRCRLQARGLFYFAGAASELELVAKEYGAPGLTQKEMKQVISHATKEPFSFLFVNMHLPWKTRFRINLNEIINIER
jgi:hypothetical protein